MMPTPRLIVIALVLALLALVPPVAHWLDQPFYVDLFARILIFAMAAVSLDLILGYGGMVSFGHAAYMGIGAYAVGILAYYGFLDGWMHFAAAILVSGLIATAIGAVSLRTSGVYFIMITLAFSQMLYFLGVSLEEFGGDDGLPSDRSEFGSLLDFWDADQFYYTVFVLLFITLYVCNRLTRSRFGMVVRGAKSNADRMTAVGFPVYRYRLAAFAISGVICGISGALYGNLNEFASPDYMHWTRSGELMVMVVIGGVGTLFGPVIGATVLILLEEWLPGWMDLFQEGTGEHWMVVLGPILILIVLYARGGIFTFLEKLFGKIMTRQTGEGGSHD